MVSSMAWIVEAMLGASEGVEKGRLVAVGRRLASRPQGIPYFAVTIGARRGKAADRQVERMRHGRPRQGL